MRQDLSKPLGLEPDPEAPQAGLEQVLLRVMRTDPDSNMVFGNLPNGEAEDRAASLTYAIHSGSPVIIDFVNLANMAKRAERGHLLEKILGTLKAIGKNRGEARPGMFDRFRGI